MSGTHTDSEPESVDNSEYNIKNEYIDDLFKDIGDNKNKYDFSNVNKTKNQHNKNLKNEQKMMNNMTSLEYFLPQERDLKKNTLPLCLNK